MSQSETGSSVRNLSEQVAFARHNFDNLQALIRFSDTKAAAILTAFIFFGLSVVPVSRDAVKQIKAPTYDQALLSACFLLSAVGFFLALIRIMLVVHQVLRPRVGRHNPAAKPGLDLLWQDHILAHGSPGAYSAAVEAASQSVILRNLTDQVYELASISSEKMRALDRARPVIMWGFLAWAVFLISSFMLMSRG